MSKRESKAQAQRDMSVQPDGYTTLQFSHPRLRREALADRGHYRMTPLEYRIHWLGRRSQDEQTARYRHDERTRYPRTRTRVA